MKTYFLIIFSAIFLVNSAKTAQAVPPPDFLFNVGSQIAQAFSIIAIFLSAALVSFRQFAGTFYQSIKYKKIFWVSMALIVVGISLGSAYFYGQYSQNKEYQKWIAESKSQNQNFEITDYSIDKMKISRPTTDTTNKIGRPTDTADNTSEKNIVALAQAAVDNSDTKAKDPNTEFIRKYYDDIGKGNLEAAYNVSKKQVSLETFKSWYKNVKSTRIDDIQNIDNNSYSVNLALTEGNTVTNYAVLVTLKQDNQGNTVIADSKVKVLGTESVMSKKNIIATHETPESVEPEPAQSVAQPTPSTEIKNPDTPIEDAQLNNNFYENNKDLPMAITNEEFQQEIDSGTPLFVLDAREDEEYEIGYFEGSTHIRFADLVAGEWIKLPGDEVIYVFCWSGMRGEEVAKFLREKHIVARYVKTGADGWVTFGGDWVGGIKFLSKYTEDRYTRLFSYNEIKEKMAKGVMIVDSRIANKYDAWHIPGSVNIPTTYTPTSDMPAVMAQIQKDTTVITVCDDFISCFDAKITGVKLEKLGHEFLGRYNKPWEYHNNEK